jgi:hypothetical protein
MVRIGSAGCLSKAKCLIRCSIETLFVDKFFHTFCCMKFWLNHRTSSKEQSICFLLFVSKERLLTVQTTTQRNSGECLRKQPSASFEFLLTKSTSIAQNKQSKLSVQSMKVCYVTFSKSFSFVIITFIHDLVITFIKNGSSTHSFIDSIIFCTRSKCAVENKTYVWRLVIKS